MLDAQSNSVWDRRESADPVVSDHLYNMIIGLTLCWGFGVNYLMVTSIPPEVVLGINRFALIIGYFVSCLIGITLFTKSDKPAISFLGYNFVVAPIGIILVPLVNAYDPMIVERALTATAGITGMMMILGAVYPAFFLSIGRTLMFALLLAIVAELLFIFIGGVHPSAFDWIFVVIFSGYIGYDWARANQIPKTVDNAMDSAAALYLDIINLFIRLLRLLGSRR